MSWVRQTVTGLAITGGVAAGGVALGVGTTLGALVKAATSAPRPVDDGPDPLLRRPPLPAHRVDVRGEDGTPINVLAWGPPDGDVLVFSHGWTCSTKHWWAQVNAFADRYRVVAYDQRGHGDTPLGSTPLSTTLLGSDLEAVLSAVVPDGRRALIAGHSMGGMSVMAWAKWHPDSVARFARAVVLTSTAAVEVLQNLAVVPEELPRFAAPFEFAVGRLVATTPLPIPSTPLSPRVVQYIALCDNARKAHVEFVDEMVTECSAVARARWGAAMLDLDVWQGVLNLAVPTAVVVGTEDRLTPQAHSDAIAAELTRTANLTEYLVLPDTGHMANIEQSGPYNRLLTDLLESTSDRAELITT
ncbi:alpha/beta fold hydrolase [Williamsia sp. CHRR-6]|uniref:alpha/beta fold hydrolase n=1 Tax=Williamsia sp. CHRR-6 TaxID=2835871 RepID=UPI001BDAB270|nr:alpha/beta hydrolase [Williamsia sp. CHRR-6]MBT0566941.1 alpha/beta hydrolase [Williamsia sp. CHRR-6]